MQKTRVLTGITTTGSPHLGNYVGAIRPAIAASRDPNTESFYFLADYHALVKCDDPARVQRSTLEIAASWLACGLDPDKVYFYRQSDIPEIPELTWLLTCVTAKGLLNRAHAYKAATDANRGAGEDADAGINAGLYMYPVLMAADILLFNAHKVPVGRDQIQHIEMARDIGQRFNFLYGVDLSLRKKLFTLPEAVIEESVATLPGLDGRKMSKSYDNTIPLWLSEKELKKAIQNIVTNSLGPSVPKNPDDSHIFTIYQAFATEEETADMRNAFAAGLSWGSAKARLFERINKELAQKREKYEKLINDREEIEKILKAGAEKVRDNFAKPTIKALREVVGIRPLTYRSVRSSEGIASTQASKVASGSTKSKPTRPQFKQYREADDKFYFSLVDGDGVTLFISKAFDSGRQAAQEKHQLVLASADNTLAILSEGYEAVPTSTGYRFEIREPSKGEIEFGAGPIVASEEESKRMRARFLVAVLSTKE